MSLAFLPLTTVQWVCKGYRNVFLAREGRVHPSAFFFFLAAVYSQNTLHHVVLRTQIVQWPHHHWLGLTVTAAEASLNSLSSSPPPPSPAPHAPMLGSLASLPLPCFHNPLRLWACSTAHGGTRSYKENTAVLSRGCTGDLRTPYSTIPAAPHLTPTSLLCLRSLGPEFLLFKVSLAWAVLV